MPKSFSSGAVGKVRFTPEDARHIARVLRLPPGTEVRAADGRGYTYRVLLRTVTPQLVTGEVLAKEEEESEPALKIHLYQSLLKGEKMDWVLQKGTEVGIFAFQPFLSSRSVARPEPAQAGKKQNRWSRIALEAANKASGDHPAVRPLLAMEALPWPAGFRPWWPGRGSKKSLRQVLAAIPSPESNPGRRAGGRVCPGRGGVFREPRRPPGFAGPPDPAGGDRRPGNRSPYSVSL